LDASDGRRRREYVCETPAASAATAAATGHPAPDVAWHGPFPRDNSAISPGQGLNRAVPGQLLPEGRSSLFVR